MSVTSSDAPDLTRLALLQRLTRTHPGFVVWKHADRAVLGRGDLDCAVPAAQLEDLVVTGLEVGATLLGASAVVECRHVADKVLLFFVQDDRLPQLLELDLCRSPSRGLAPWAAPETMLGLSTVDHRGVRRLRPGAEAVVSLVYHGLSASGRPRLCGDELGIFRRGTREDGGGASAACLLLPPWPARRALARLLDVAAKGGWDRSAAAAAWWGFVVSGAAHPMSVARRSLFRARLRLGRECVMSDLARRHDRKVDAGAVAALLVTAEKDGHRVLRYDVGEGPPLG